MHVWGRVKSCTPVLVVQVVAGIRSTSYPQRRYRQERRGEPSLVRTSACDFWGLICASFPVSGIKGKGIHVGETPWDPVHPGHLSTSPFAGGAPVSCPLPPSAQRDFPPASCRLNHPPVLLLFLSTTTATLVLAIVGIPLESVDGTTLASSAATAIPADHSLSAAFLVHVARSGPSSTPKIAPEFFCRALPTPAATKPALTLKPTALLDSPAEKETAFRKRSGFWGLELLPVGAAAATLAQLG